MKKIVIIGAGMGGLATALRLSNLGYEVSIYEKLSKPGGRTNLITENGFRVDTGPTILVMKKSFDEFYQSIEENIEDRVKFIQLDPNYRIYFHDKTYMDLSNNMAQLAREMERFVPGSAEWVFKFIGDSAKKYELGMGFVDRNYDRITDLANPSALVKLLQTRAHQNLYNQVSRYFHGDDKFSKAFSFHSMFLGLSPMKALAMYSLITYADIALGMWYPQGGIYRIIEDMVLLCRQKGVQLFTSSPVKQIIINDGMAKGILLESGKEIRADIVISNADLPYTYRYLLSEKYRKPYTIAKLAHMDYACSGFLLYLGLDRTYPNMQHQALYFSKDYKSNLDAIFKFKQIPDDPSFHLNNPTITDPSLAPPGHHLLYILAPMPNLQSNINWQEESPKVRNLLIHKLQEIVDPDIEKHIIWEKRYTPMDFQQDFNAVYGTAFGSLSQGFFQSSYFRPHNVASKVKNLFFVGQATYPGIGMPMVLISSKLVIERIING